MKQIIINNETTEERGVMVSRVGMMREHDEKERVSKYEEQNHRRKRL